MDKPLSAEREGGDRVSSTEEGISVAANAYLRARARADNLTELPKWGLSEHDEISIEYAGAIVDAVEEERSAFLTLRSRVYGHRERTANGRDT